MLLPPHIKLPMNCSSRGKQLVANKRGLCDEITVMHQVIKIQGSILHQVLAKVFTFTYQESKSAQTIVLCCSCSCTKNQFPRAKVSGHPSLRRLYSMSLKSKRNSLKFLVYVAGSMYINIRKKELQKALRNSRRKAKSTPVSGVRILLHATVVPKGDC